MILASVLILLFSDSTTISFDPRRFIFALSVSKIRSWKLFFDISATMNSENLSLSTITPELFFIKPISIASGAFGGFVSDCHVGLRRVCRFCSTGFA